MSSNDNSEKPEHVVIAGSGIIGLSTAYYLATKHQIRSTIVDPTGMIAPAASGKAGGFLALDWNDHSPTGPLTRRSFALHQELANVFQPETIQYRRLTCASISVDPYNRNRRPSGKKLQGIEWAESAGTATTTAATTAVTASKENSSVLGIRPMGDETTIAQVHPKLLCQQMWKVLSEEHGAQLKQGKVVGSAYKNDDDGTSSSPKSLRGALLDNGEVVDADAVLMACGPWTANIMYGVKYHSVVVPTVNDQVLTQCVFFSGCGDPEVYVRPDATAYCTGYPDPPVIVTEEPGQEAIDPHKVETILQSVRDASGGADYSIMKQDPVLEQACYLPTTSDGLPVMGELDNLPQTYIATGHTCWGILMGPASGEAMATLIATGTTPSSIRTFQPSRFGNLQLRK